MKRLLICLLLFALMLPAYAQEERVTVRDADNDAHDLGISTGADGTRTTDFAGEAGTVGFVQWIVTIASGVATMEWVNPVSNGFGWWTRTGSVLSPVNADDTISLDHIQFDLTPTLTPAEGMFYWNDDDKTFNIKTETDTVVQVGQEQLVRGTNKTGVALLNGTLVYINGAQGNRPTFAKAKADVIATSESTLGIVTSDIADNANGYVTTFGLVRELDTSGEVAGDMVYLSAATAGGWTTTKPAKGNQIIEIGIIVRVDASLGIIFARIQTTKDIGELNDVDLTSPVNGHMILFDDATSLWKNTNTIEQDSSSTTGSALTVTRDLTSGDTNDAVVRIVQDHLDDDQSALFVRQDSDETGAVALLVSATTATANIVNGIVASTASTHNLAFGGDFDKLKAGIYLDFDEAGAPAVTNTDDVRLYALTGGRMFTVDDTITIGPLGSELATVTPTSTPTTIAPTVGMPNVTTVDASGGTRTITLPAAASWTGQFITIIKTDSTSNIVIVDGNAGETINGGLTYELIIRNESITIVTDGSNWFVTASNTHKLIDLATYIDIKTRNNPEVHGAMVNEVTAGVLDSLFALPFTHGQGRVKLVINAGVDTTGTITINGTSVDRDDSQSETGSDTEDITIAGLTTDNTTTDALGATVWDFQDCYVSTKWWQGSITLTTTDVDISDIDVYLVNFDQFGDHTSVVVESLEVEGFKTNTAGAMSAHLYSVILQTGNKYDIQSIADLEHTAAKTATDTRVKMRVGDIGVAFDGSTDGLFLDMQLDRTNQPDWEDVTTRIHSISLCDPV